MGAMTALAVIKSIKKYGNKVMPTIRAFACKQCYTLAAVSVQGNTIKVIRCGCGK